MKVQIYEKACNQLIIDLNKSFSILLWKVITLIN